ncbi:alpha/beta-hydrolase [Apiospora saccharicola]|uniref:Alpha/beta-hydrolase n=1 Tax=Apiospora saccharicola TaxID=335842 RepID=A0ABR1U409_9PEZI
MATSSSDKPAVVLVHGGWHIPSTYSKLVGLLQSSGLDVHVPRLPSMNEARPPNVDLATDTEHIRSYVENLVDAGRSVVAVMHSYGGQVGTNALTNLSLESRAKRGLPGRCRGPRLHVRVRAAGGRVHAFDFDEKDNSVICRDPKTSLIGDGDGAGTDEVEAYLASLVRWNGTCMYQAISQCAWREVPVTYIYTSVDMTVLFDYQKSMVEMMRKEGRKVATVELSTGHCPNLTKTQEVADVIWKVAMGEVVGE